jgi:hypothetical protein
MSYTYNPGTRPDALSILRDKGLLDTPARTHPQPGTFVLSAAGHFRIGDDGRAVPVPPKYPVRVASDDVLRSAHRPSVSVGLSKLVIFGLTPICFIAWLVSR